MKIANNMDMEQKDQMLYAIRIGNDRAGLFRYQRWSRQA